MSEHPHNGKEVHLTQDPVSVSFASEGRILLFNGRMTANSPRGPVDVAFDGLVNLASVSAINLSRPAHAEAATCTVRLTGLGVDIDVGPVKLEDARTIAAVVMMLMSGKDPAPALLPAPVIRAGQASDVDMPVTEQAD